MIPKIAISLGDPNGIGPEVALKSLKHLDLQKSIPILVGSNSVMDFYGKSLQKEKSVKHYDAGTELIPGDIYFHDISEPDGFLPHPGEIGSESGALSMKSVEKAAELCLDGSSDAMVTSPISKEAIQLGGYAFPGHTEFLAEKTGREQVLMMLVSTVFRVALATIHIPIKDVSGSLSIDGIVARLKILNRSLQADFGISEPKIGVLGLNPHAGDGGYIGSEEIDIIIPALEEARAASLNAEGPFPADGYFANQRQKKYHATFAMYHDQGLIPFKALSFGKGVNFTAGLPIIRTSPDHGTAFDIAGKNLADPKSFMQAYELAVTMVMNRKNSDIEV